MCTLLDSCGLAKESSLISSCKSKAGDSSCRFRLISYSEAIESLLCTAKLRSICEKDPSRYCAALWKSLKNGTAANSNLCPVRVSHNGATGVTRILDGNHGLCRTRVFGCKNGEIDAIVDTCDSPGDTNFSGHIGGESYFSSRRFQVSSKTVMKRYHQFLDNLLLTEDEGHELLNVPFDSLFCWIDRFLR